MEFQFSLNEIETIAQKVLDSTPNKIILFNGEMGAGKTTFIKALTKIMGVKGNTSSPTFSLVNEYEASNNEIVYHFDFYRLKNETEAIDMGVDEYLYSGHWCFIEWAENIPNLIPEEHSRISIKALADGNRLLELL
ncbi:tRNA (adenosine(37)-N6)-threonylcarbamoyltransferase complex ATPase subunit type 1 TsaE [Flavobacterium algicola]|uniref:tRNA (adenosine(37)-N6)-threonylcarbamoyltransferase complex ATPase subunit type 1 TsaE n=1 Tax=Flavobacterium algicola TaxID=556529 RepID=UPI001EFD5296|nr:tRNA (adenosine(37)-N6)-threonylcarbamoyltransferase complex ATPase subunit type 1 TsaE [Flavobacterium algicola]MCG9792785.1 tRNA (adenosine(37)-N6)-threonylcarbamoyltransferase complex ATPase subunit type 1 TsaE [Flavobacterium algicola]